MRNFWANSETANEVASENSKRKKEKKKKKKRTRIKKKQMFRLMKNDFRSPILVL